MKQYYYLDNQNQKIGPVDLATLKAAGITSNTNVWHDGLTGWVKASSIPELGLPATPPQQPVPNPAPNYAGSTKPNSWMWLGICSTILCCLPLGIVSIVYASKVDSAWMIGNQEMSELYSKKAKNWGIASAVTAIAFWAIYIIVILIGVSNHQADIYDFYDLY